MSSLGNSGLGGLRSSGSSSMANNRPRASTINNNNNIGLRGSVGMNMASASNNADDVEE